MTRILALALTALLAVPLAASAQGDAKNVAKQGVSGGLVGGKGEANDAVAEARRALVDASQKSSLTMPVVLFVKSKATGFGMYDARGSDIFKPGEKLSFYVEPQGYKFKTTGDTVSFGIAMDIALTSPAGEILYHQDNFLNQDFTSHHANEELMLNGDLDINGAKPGDYVLELTLHDKLASGTASAKLPFTIR